MCVILRSTNCIYCEICSWRNINILDTAKSEPLAALGLACWMDMWDWLWLLHQEPCELRTIANNGLENEMISDSRHFAYRNTNFAYPNSPWFYLSLAIMTNVCCAWLISSYLVRRHHHGKTWALIYTCFIMLVTSVLGISFHLS